MMSYYQAVINPERCISCGMCSDTCPMKAIEERTPSYNVMDKRCIGCGLCINKCPEQAISLRELADKKDAPLESVEHILDRLTRERGLC